MSRPASGEQFLLVHGDQRAVVTEVGATFREYEVGGIPVCLGFGEDEIAPGSKGQVLAPWPSRLLDGSYDFEGVHAQAGINDLQNNDAIHGLVRWDGWQLEEKGEDRVLLSDVVQAQPAYPFTVRIAIRYTLGDEGLEIVTTATNEGRRRAPFGVGFHSYLHAGPGKVDACSLSLPARKHVVTAERRRPVGEEPVEGTDFAALCDPEGDRAPEGDRGPESDRAAEGLGGVIGSRVLLDCFTDLAPGADGRWRARFARGPAVTDRIEVWGEPSFRWMVVYSGDNADAASARQGLALEPLTCAPNGLASGEGLAVLDPGGSFEARWGIAPAWIGS